ncbi:ubiquitin-protein ligase E3A-like protein [Syncephalis pseudoplumigaleata]|uniref:HECT-type E3 ubiquitin transferase n=1 Tax=Syncephalis pseudoplumigaleata TaxID=1712513 RepID=A0A4P9YZM0_9FUNG|nr:ubiquitin-protein ligase E3A-like protein [Syncephalis pseudoplumigaleata]|eukprot:RKP24490.1 ubiquitin-protein ligase E3A-like protein [Syncephalis pseudoplumigaleata]
MFTWHEESGRCWFARNPDVNRATLDEYQLIGRLIGLAIYNAVMLDVHLPTALYKKLLRYPVQLADLKTLDPSMERGLRAMLEMDDEQLGFMEQTYEVEYECFGRRYTHDLLPNGASVPVTQANCGDFVDRYVSFLLNESVQGPFDAFKEGFDQICGKSTIQIFRPEELEMIVCGSQEFDFHALEQATKYDGGYEAASPVIRHFWSVAHALDEERKKQLLFFATGTDRIPLGGLGKLAFTIARNGGDSDRLPTAHTCFNVLLLPDYSSLEKLRDRLLTAINNSEGFGMI